jgi:hypothetical protein
MMKVVFLAEVDLSEEQLAAAEDDTMQAVQNLVGHTGVQVGSIEFEDDDGC